MFFIGGIMIAVIPINDIKSHNDYSTTCECNPDVEIVNNEIIITHNAFDKRELDEQINEILKEAKMECPKCNKERIVKDNGSIYCENCFYHFKPAQRKSFTKKQKRLIPKRHYYKTNFIHEN